MRRSLVIFLALMLIHCAETPGFESGNQSDPYLGPIPASFTNTLSPDRLSMAVKMYRLEHAPTLGLYDIGAEAPEGVASCRALNSLVGEMVDFDARDASGFALTPGSSCYGLTKHQNLKFSGAIAAVLASLDLGDAGNAFPDACSSLMEQQVTRRAERSFALVPIVGPASAWQDNLQNLTGSTWIGGNETHLAARTTLQATLRDQNADYRVAVAIWADRRGDLTIGRVETFTSVRDGKRLETIVKTDIVGDKETSTLVEKTKITRKINGETDTQHANDLQLTPGAAEGEIAISLQQDTAQAATEEFAFSLSNNGSACTVN